MLAAAFAATASLGASWPWYLVRGSGFTAAALLILLMISGIGQVTGLTYKVLEPVKAWAVHKAMALALCGVIVVHVIGILIDKFVSFSLLQVLVPFQTSYTNGSRILGVSFGPWAVSLGILAMYGVVIIVATSLGWIDTHKRTWRWLHYLGYFVMLAAFLHGLSVGTDLRYGTFRAVWIGALLVVLLAVISRLARAGTLRRKRPSAGDEPQS